MKMYPNLRGARPRKWFWLSYVIPTVTVWHSFWCIAFVRNGHKSLWHPVQKGWAIKIRPNKPWFARPRPWHVNKIQFIKLV